MEIIQPRKIKITARISAMHAASSGLSQSVHCPDLLESVLHIPVDAFMEKKLVLSWKSTAVQSGVDSFVKILY